MEHQLQKQDGRWICQICRWDWAGKPRKANCSGVPVVSIREKRDRKLATIHELKQQNLKPVGAEIAHLVSSTRQPILLYEAEKVEVDNPDLPPIYRWGQQPPELKTFNQLRRYNKRPGENTKPRGCYWCNDVRWEYFYHPDDCVIDDESLPPCYAYDQIPPDLQTERKLKNQQLFVEGVQPRACFRVWNERDTCWDTIMLYHPDDCRFDPEGDRWLTKTALQEIYFLSKTWIKRIGAADRTLDNPYKRSGCIYLYSKHRIEAFLANHAEEYSEWLQKRDRYVQLFEQHRDKIEAGRLAVKERQLEQKRQKVRERVEQHVALLSDPVCIQQVRCLQCASGMALPDGFLCALYPAGLELEQLPCQDWSPRIKR